jgi:hypothetical protein
MNERDDRTEEENDDRDSVDSELLALLREQGVWDDVDDQKELERKYREWKQAGLKRFRARLAESARQNQVTGHLPYSNLTLPIPLAEVPALLQLFEVPLKREALIAAAPGRPVVPPGNVRFELGSGEARIDAYLNFPTSPDEAPTLFADEVVEFSIYDKHGEKIDWTGRLAELLGHEVAFEGNVCRVSLSDLRELGMPSRWCIVLY